jgi:hypothetical protein
MRMAPEAVEKMLKLYQLLRLGGPMRKGVAMKAIGVNPFHADAFLANVTPVIPIWESDDAVLGVDIAGAIDYACYTVVDGD